jgi:hypothetical protein
MIRTKIKPKQKVPRRRSISFQDFADLTGRSISELPRSDTSKSQHSRTSAIGNSIFDSTTIHADSRIKRKREPPDEGTNLFHQHHRSRSSHGSHHSRRYEGAYVESGPELDLNTIFNDDDPRWQTIDETNEGNNKGGVNTWDDHSAIMDLDQEVEMVVRDALEISG